MGDPLLVGERVEADARGPAPVAVAQDVRGEGRRRRRRRRSPRRARRGGSRGDRRGRGASVGLAHQHAGAGKVLGWLSEALRSYPAACTRSSRSAVPAITPALCASESAKRSSAAMVSGIGPSGESVAKTRWSGPKKLNALQNPSRRHPRRTFRPALRCVLARPPGARRRRRGTAPWPSGTRLFSTAWWSAAGRRG